MKNIMCAWAMSLSFGKECSYMKPHMEECPEGPKAHKFEQQGVEGSVSPVLNSEETLCHCYKIFCSDVLNDFYEDFKQMGNI